MKACPLFQLQNTHYSDEPSNFTGNVAGSVKTLLSMMTSKIASFSIGGYAQANRALAYSKNGLLKAVEFTLPSGRRGDLLLKNGTAVEVKSWTKWDSWLPEWRKSKLENLGEQIVDYLAHSDVKKLKLEFKSFVPAEVSQLVSGLPAELASRVRLRVFN